MAAAAKAARDARTKEYFERIELPVLLDEALGALAAARPASPRSFLAAWMGRGPAANQQPPAAPAAAAPAATTAAAARPPASPREAFAGSAPWRTPAMVQQLTSPAAAPADPPADAAAQPLKRRSSKQLMKQSFRKVKSKIAVQVQLQQQVATQQATVDVRRLKDLQPKGQRGVVEEGPAEKAAFVAGKWMPFVKRCHTFRDLAREHAQSNLNVVDRIPCNNFEIHDMLCECMYLTGQWYGRGKANISFMYEWFLSISEIAGISQYSFDQIRTQWSKDKWMLLVDSALRGQILSAVRKRNEVEREAGEWTQQQGVSAIDNTLLNNIFTPSEATLLLAGEVCHRFTVVMLCFRQERALRIIGGKIGMPLLHEQDPDMIKAVLDKMDADTLRGWGIEPENVSYRALQLTGKRTWNWGQIPAEYRVRMHKHFNEDLLSRNRQLDPTDTFAKFVEHAKKKPGEYVDGDRLRHVVTLFAGAICGKLVLITRTEMEKHTKAKYLAVQWKRKCDLRNTEGKVLRPGGTIEHLRLRINEAGYTHAHGMSLSGTGVVEEAVGEFQRIRQGRGRGGLSAAKIDAEFEVILAREMNLPRDPGARLANWYLIDIEKILHEVRLFNPPGLHAAADLLPFEAFHEVGQNPKVGSSIAATQHTQIGRAALSTWPVYQLSTKPRYYEQLQSSLDIVQVGEQADGVFLKLRTQNPVMLPVISFLCDLKWFLMQNCSGGAVEVDFNVKALVDDLEGGFAVIFAPLAQLQKGPSGNADFGLINPDTGEKDDGSNTVCKIDTGKGGGLVMLSAENNHAQWRRGIDGGEVGMRKLYDFCRKPGARALMERFIAERFGVVP